MMSQMRYREAYVGMPHTGKSKLLTSITTAEGAHHVAYTKNGRFAYGLKTLCSTCRV